MTNIFLVSHILLLFHPRKGSRNMSTKYEEIGTYWSYCARNRAITTNVNCLIFILRSSCPEVFCKKDVLRNFAKFKGKHLCQRLFFNKVAGLRPATLLEKSLCHRYCWISSGGSIFLYRQLL